MNQRPAASKEEVGTLLSRAPSVAPVAVACSTADSRADTDPIQSQPLPAVSRAALFARLGSRGLLLQSVLERMKLGVAATATADALAESAELGWRGRARRTAFQRWLRALTLDGIQWEMDEAARKLLLRGTLRLWCTRTAVLRASFDKVGLALTLAPRAEDFRHAGRVALRRFWQRWRRRHTMEFAPAEFGIAFGKRMLRLSALRAWCDEAKRLQQASRQFGGALHVLLTRRRREGFARLRLGSAMEASEAAKAAATHKCVRRLILRHALRRWHEGAPIAAAMAEEAVETHACVRRLILRQSLQRWHLGAKSCGINDVHALVALFALVGPLALCLRRWVLNHRKQGIMRLAAYCRWKLHRRELCTSFAQWRAVAPQLAKRKEAHSSSSSQILSTAVAMDSLEPVMPVMPVPEPVPGNVVAPSEEPANAVHPETGLQSTERSQKESQTHADLVEEEQHVAPSGKAAQAAAAATASSSVQDGVATKTAEVAKEAAAVAAAKAAQKTAETTHEQACAQIGAAGHSSPSHQSPPPKASETEEAASPPQEAKKGMMNRLTKGASSAASAIADASKKKKKGKNKKS